MTFSHFLLSIICLLHYIPSVCVTHRPPGRAGTVSSDVVARSSILTGAALLTLRPMTTGGAALSTAAITQVKNQMSQRTPTFLHSKCQGSKCFWYSQSSSVTRFTDALSCLVAAGSTIETLALQLARLAIETVLAGLLTTPSLVPVGADTGARNGVTFSSILALATITAVRSPEIALTACRYTEKTNRLEWQTKGENEAAFNLKNIWIESVI